MDGMAETGNAEALLPAAFDGGGGRLSQRIVVVTVGPRSSEKHGGVARRPQQHAAGAEQPGRHRALDRLGRACVGEPGSQSARGEAVVGERDEHGVEHPALAGRGLASGDEEVGEISEAHRAHELAGQIAAGDGDAVGRR